MSKSLNKFIVEAGGSQTKTGLQNLIANTFFKYASSSNPDTKAMLLLIAALTLLNSGDDTQTLNAARRLATSGMSSRNSKV